LCLSVDLRPEPPAIAILTIVVFETSENVKIEVEMILKAS
jgi:hypothetical protein